MKILIKGIGGSDTHSGIYGLKGEIAPGTELTLQDEPPAAWAGKYEVIEKNASSGAVALTGKNKAELLAIAKAENVTVEDNATNADIVSAIELAREEAAKA
ncbi:hypothetical protein WBP06_09445 [Novosphingobium sp. BL-8H]|uniref:hypothetical protein n=1 Tax=Novosphingobium sp. BL-8H TaxID=3127640 RepID=UPI003756DC1F